MFPDQVMLFDTETTGLVKNSAIPLDSQPRIIELFALGLDRGKEANAYSQLFRSLKPLSERVTEITSITDEMLKGKPPFSDHAEGVKEMIESCDLVVAHNLSFDKAVIDYEMARAELEPVEWPQLLCTVEATEYIKGFRLSLAMLHEHLFGEGFEDAHRAENDVRALTRCYIKLVEEGEV